MLWLILAVICISGCALEEFSRSPDGRPVYVLGNPACILGCASNMGTVRGGASSPGDLSLGQDANASAKSGVISR